MNLINWGIFFTGILVFLARIVDVSIGTLRTLSIVRGKTRIAFFLGFFEISMWLLVLSTVLDKVMNYPIIALFYAFGFSTGNVVGILLEKKLAFGQIVIRIITNELGTRVAEEIREAGFPVTTVPGEGAKGKVLILFIACERKNLKRILPIVESIAPNAFYVIEHAGSVSKIYNPIYFPKTGWRAVFKKK